MRGTHALVKDTAVELKLEIFGAEAKRPRPIR